MSKTLRRLDRVESFHDFVFMDYSMDHDAITLMIDAWHESDSDKELHEYLGWTWDEYRHYVENNALPW